MARSSAPQRKAASTPKAKTSTKGQRTCTDAELPRLLELIGENSSLRAACRALGLHHSKTLAWIRADEGREAQYERAREVRAEAQQELALKVTMAAATGEELKLPGMKRARAIDPAGARVLLDAIKWSSARMAPKTAPRTPIDVNMRVGMMTDEELLAELGGLGGGAA